MNIEYRVEEITLAETYPLRRRVLRDATPSDAVEMIGDDNPTTFHLGARDARGRVLAISTWMPKEWDLRPGRRGVRLRGMASDRAVRSLGIGGAVLDAGIERCRRSNTQFVWANARVPALEFYQRYGFDPVGDEFIDETTAIPHLAIVLDL